MIYQLGLILIVLVLARVSGEPGEIIGNATKAFSSPGLPPGTTTTTTTKAPSAVDIGSIPPAVQGSISIGTTFVVALISFIDFFDILEDCFSISATKSKRDQSLAHIIALKESLRRGAVVRALRELQLDDLMKAFSTGDADRVIRVPSGEDLYNEILEENYHLIEVIEAAPKKSVSNQVNYRKSTTKFL